MNHNKKGNGGAGIKEFTRKFYEKNRLAFTATVVLLTAISLLEVLLAYILQELLDAASGGSTERLVRLVMISGVYFAGYAVLFLLKRQTENRFVEKAAGQYKDYAFSRLLRKNIRSFTEETGSTYISALTNDTAAVQTGYLSGTLELIVQFVYFFGALGMMLWYSWTMTLTVIVLSLIPILISLSFGGMLTKAEKQVSDKNETFVGMVGELLSGFPVIKSFKAEKEAFSLYGRANHVLEDVKCRRRKTADLIGLISGVAGGILQIAVFVYGAFLAIRGRITPGVVIAFVQLMNFVLTPVNKIPVLLANRKASIALIEKLASCADSNASEGGNIRLTGIGEGIRLEQVTFGYPESEPILKDMNLTFQAGKSYAIVGSSGSGKTTLLNLLLGSFSDYRGKVTIGGCSLPDISTECLYDLLSIIQQNVFIFNSSLRENITMFKQFGSEEVDRAAQKAGLAALMKEKGEEYRCGENGSALSGGEKQRISIARCLLKNTPVLLMDEATAALDAETAHAVSSSILDIDGLTRIIVTHRLEESLLKRYDEIIVLHGGGVAEQGSFEELMERKGYFYSLFRIAA